MLLVFGLIYGLLGELTYGLLGRPLEWLRNGLFWGLIGGLLVGWFACFWYGGQDVIQHYMLRFILYWKGHTPLRYANFLDYAAKLVFLQKVGGGYIFIHRLLLEHFAAMKDADEGATGTPLRH